MDIDERYRRPNKQEVERLIPEYRDFIDEFVAVRETFGKYAGIDGMAPGEAEILIEVVKARQLIEMKDILEEVNEKLEFTLNYFDKRDGIAGVLVDTNTKIEDLRETIDRLR